MSNQQFEKYLICKGLKANMQLTFSTLFYYIYKHYQGASRTAAPILTVSGSRVDPASTLSTTVSPGPPWCPQDWQRTGLLLIAQPTDK